ncbi:hypothetical protein GQ53DRAFT_779743 [Thozetella sp. PMI_491]|nr:hypothetical protein GQ53DRAFT_779743 [Thozetella sp. PMI_491]
MASNPQDLALALRSVASYPWALTTRAQLSLIRLATFSRLRDVAAGPFRSGARKTLLISFLAAAVLLECWRRMAQKKPDRAKATVSPHIAVGYDPDSTDPALLARNSEIKTYSTSRYTYPDLRVFFRRHQHFDQLPKSPAPLPLLVFIHGLGGSVAQFHPLLVSLTPTASCLAVDAPGCGRSKLSERAWDAYTTDALAELLEVIIDDYRDKDADQPVILIGHSMGASLAALLAAPRAPARSDLSKYVTGLVAICPPAGPPDEKKVAIFRKMMWIPETIFNLWRAWDQWGGPDSASVQRFVGPEADPEAKRLQAIYNSQSRSSTFRRMANGTLPNYEDGVPKGGLPGGDVWSRIKAPVYLVGGAKDSVTPPKEVDKIAAYLQGAKPASSSDDESEAIPDSAAPVDTNLEPERHLPGSLEEISNEDFHRERKPSDPDHAFEDPSTPNERQPPIPPQPLHPKKVVKTTILPEPATHALLYTPNEVRVLAGLISYFLANHVTQRLSLGWQLQFLSQEGKWDVKNLEKWQKVAALSEPIAGTFRAMKTLRDVDEAHTPKVFAKTWAHTVKDIIDISHDNPVYNPQDLEAGGIHYHKFPTVSKVPPEDKEIEEFIALVDQVRERQKRRAQEENWDDGYVVGVHCHYGFNRTGFFVVCYLVERCDYSVQNAIETFAKARPNGIRHEHFKDRLFLRYSGLEKKGPH